MGFDWYKCRFLESGENIQALVQKRFGRKPSSTIARDITACLLQGRLFYEAAQSSPLEIRPLQLFYGMLGFSRALILAHRLTHLCTLARRHGLKDASSPNCRISDLKVEVRKGGTFQEFNDVVSELNRLCYIESWQYRSLKLKTANSERLAGLTLTLKELLSRIPGLESLYRSTFQESPNTGALEFYDHGEQWRVHIFDQEFFTDRDSLKKMVEKWRILFPFLKSWYFIGGQHSWSQSLIMFENIDNTGIDEFGDENLFGEGDEYDVKLPAGFRRFSLADRLSPLAGSFSERTYGIAPIDGLYLSEFSLHYLAMYLLSSLVRYRPQTWAHAVSRTSISDAPADDQALALIESFLSLNSMEIPSFVVKALNPYEDKYA